jgi:hypothetical protein
MLSCLGDRGMGPGLEEEEEDDDDDDDFTTDIFYKT